MTSTKTPTKKPMNKPCWKPFCADCGSVLKKHELGCNNLPQRCTPCSNERAALAAKDLRDTCLKCKATLTAREYESLNIGSGGSICDACWAKAQQDVTDADAKAKAAVNHPAHYGGAEDPYEAIKVIEAWKLGFCLGNALKYIRRADHKEDDLKDLKKAAWYLAREIERRSA